MAGAPLLDDQDDVLLASINTTPLVDVMLVLLIIFLITIPVALQTVPLTLPQEATERGTVDPGTISISVDRQGKVYWNDQALADIAALEPRLRQLAATIPQPAIHLRGDHQVAYAAMAAVVDACRQAGIDKVGFLTDPVASPP
ncbi:MAG: ExbD/TolR family protein [Magnetospirillum sp.]